MTGLESILPFFPEELRPYLLDHDISELQFLGPELFWVERKGMRERIPITRAAWETNGLNAERSLLVAIERIAARLDEEFSESRPILDARLPSGDRVAAVRPPVSVNGVALTIRRFNKKSLKLCDLVKLESVTPVQAATLAGAMEEKVNLLISGGTGSGKTTLLNALARFIPEDRRIVVIEDTAEIFLEQPNVLRMEARRANGELEAVTIAGCLRHALRQSPDVLLLGEFRGGEAFDLLQLLNTGHQGSISTCHANSAREALTRFANSVLKSGVDIPYEAVKQDIGMSVQMVVHLKKQDRKRIVSEVCRVEGYDSESKQFVMPEAV